MKTTLAFTVAGLLAISTQRGDQAGDFEWRGRLEPGQRVTIRGVSGTVRAVPASGFEVVVTGSRHGRDAGDVRIESVPHSGGVTVCAIYPASRRDEPGECTAQGRSRGNDHHTRAEVDFTVSVPAGIDFEGRTVNGDVVAEGLSGRIDAHTVNGEVRVSTSGLAEASSVNGDVTVSLGRADWSGLLEFGSVNGRVSVTLPASASTTVRASTLNGGIDSDFPLTLSGSMSRREVRATIGSGGRDLGLKSVNGEIRIRKAP